jgi:hypothetical protein
MLVGCGLQPVQHCIVAFGVIVAACVDLRSRAAVLRIDGVLKWIRTAPLPPRRRDEFRSRRVTASPGCERLPNACL